MNEILPRGWQTKRLRFVTRRQPTTKQREALSAASMVTFLPMEAIGEQGALDLSIVRDIDDVRTGYTQFFDGDVLVAKITPCFENGKGALVRGTLQGIGFGTTELHVVAPSEELDGRFLYYITASEPFRKLGEAQMTGAAGQKRVPEDFVRDYKAAIPPIDEQRAIANYLDRETARLDALVAAKERLCGLLAEKRRALITHAVTRGLDSAVALCDSGISWLGEITAHWRVTRLKFVAEVRGGLTLGKNYGGADLSEYPYLRVANVQDGRLDLSDVATVFVPKNEVESYLLRSGDVLMNEGGDADKLGRGCVWRAEIAPCLHQNHVFAVRPKLVNSEWLDAWTATDGAKGYFESRAKQSTNLASISATSIKELPILFPPEHEQRVILAHIKAETAKLDAIRSATERTIALLKERRAALIGAAVTGAINVQEAIAWTA